MTLNYLAGGAFQSRYSAIVFPFFVLLVARGFTTLRDPRILGRRARRSRSRSASSGGVRNVVTQRTQAPAGRGGAAPAKPSPATSWSIAPTRSGPRCTGSCSPGSTRSSTRASPGRSAIDWVDYKKRLAAADPAAFAQAALARAGSHTLWYVSAPGYITHVGICEGLSDDFAAARHAVQRTLSDDKIFEKPELQMFPAPAKG